MFIESDLKASISRAIRDLNDLKVGTKEYNLAIEGLTKLIESDQAYDKMNIERTEGNRKYNLEAAHVEVQRLDLELRRSSLSHDKCDAAIKNVLTLLSVTTPAIMFAWAAIGSWDFEKDYSTTTTVGKRAVDKLLSMKLY